MKPDEQNLAGILSVEKECNAKEALYLARLVLLFARNAMPPDPIGMMPDYLPLKRKLLIALKKGNAVKIEEAFLNLYCHVHGYDAPYTKGERSLVTKTGGYWCHAGGISPIIKAGEFITPKTVFADYGAGNGLQGLLTQYLFPHKLTMQIEISNKMVLEGKALQKWMKIPDDRVKWIVQDVMEASFDGIDFFYLYRPVKPDGPGKKFYERMAKKLGSFKHEITIFSVADCLKDFLTKDFEKKYSDGHLTCYKKAKQNYEI